MTGSCGGVQPRNRMMHAAAPFEWSNFLGPFHVVMLHLPIGAFVLAVLLEIWATRRPSEGARQAVAVALGFSVAASWMVALLGYLRASHGEYDAQVVYWHTVLGLAFALLITATWLLYVKWYPAAQGARLRLSYRGLLAVSSVCLVAAAHGGGTLTHGSKFLTEGAPPALNRFLGNLESSAKPDPRAAAQMFPTQIEPILARKCYPCHGAEKQKGKLRLDQRDLAMKGGSSGEPALVPGDPLKSRLIVVSLLPPDHDEVMPPEGKEALTADETMALIRWIQSGASYGEPAIQP